MHHDDASLTPNKIPVVGETIVICASSGVDLFLSQTGPSIGSFLVVLRMRLAGEHDKVHYLKQESRLPA